MNIRSLACRAATLLAAATIAATAAHAADAPTAAIVDHAMKLTWDKKAGPMNARTVMTLNAVKFGKPYRATVQEVQVEGLPADATVTPAIVDFSVRTYNDRQTDVLRRVRDARVYKDKMNEWAVMTGSPRGQDETSVEPAVR